ncbi:NAD(P)-binding protein [Pleomassaria siparia CBS 279.74]|uniref:NAD(P)-binding protein n=1 Tax=Pleomassaria siparia CBS 279.74 TaxID=1314801 RepID=A0A6G1JXT0_9PLEO|nr:NAD(P)-binding protein [Pleomassaria siparia CBS 279.74]
MAHVDRLSNVRVLVFGGTSGIGFAVANLVLSKGSQVIISGSKQAKVDDKVALLQSYYPSNPASNITGHAVDLLDTPNLEKNLTALFDTVTEQGQKKLDHIVFTAGDALTLPKVDNVTTESAMLGFKVRLQAPVIIGKLIHTGKYVTTAPSSSFTVTGGTNTKKPMKGWFMGASFGASIEGCMRGLAVDLAPVRVNMVQPGMIDTEILQKFFSQFPAETVEQMKLTHGLLGTIGEPSDVAEAYAWLMRDRNVTGTVAASDNGRLLKG